jgi:hypothetical protein
MKDPSKSLTRLPCSVRGGQCVFTIAHCSVSLTNRYTSDKHYTKQQIMLCCIHCLVNWWHLKIMCKTQYSQTGHGWQNGDCVFHVGYLRLQTPTHNM